MKSSFSPKGRKTSNEGRWISVNELDFCVIFYFPSRSKKSKLWVSISHTHAKYINTDLCILFYFDLYLLTIGELILKFNPNWAIVKNFLIIWIFIVEKTKSYISLKFPNVLYEIITHREPLLSTRYIISKVICLRISRRAILEKLYLNTQIPCCYVQKRKKSSQHEITLHTKLITSVIKRHDWLPNIGGCGWIRVE